MTKRNWVSVIAWVWFICALPKPAQHFVLVMIAPFAIGYGIRYVIRKVVDRDRHDDPTPEEPAPEEQRPAGWYPDPDAPLSSERYWNGRAWSDLPPRPMGPPPGVSSPAFTLPPLPPEGKARGKFFSR